MLNVRKNRNIKLKREIDGKINPYSRLLAAFKKLENIDKNELIFYY